MEKIMDNELNDFFEIIKEQVNFDKFNIKKKFHYQKALEDIINHHKNLGFDIAKNGHLKNIDDNLIDSFSNWDEIQNELMNGQGSELKEKTGKLNFYQLDHHVLYV
jgi:predicted ATP-dependent endonuclease of OLD family